MGHPADGSFGDRGDRARAWARGRGVERHRALLPADEVTRYRGIPVTSVPRTLLDLAAVLDANQLARAVSESKC